MGFSRMRKVDRSAVYAVFVLFVAWSTRSVSASPPIVEPGDCDGIPKPCNSAPPEGAKYYSGTNILLPPDDVFLAMDRVSGNVGLLLYNERFADLDAIIARYAKLEDVMTDGKFKLAAVEVFIGHDTSNRPPEAIRQSIDAWRAFNPHSSGAALLDAAYWRSQAWKARGDGFANTVSPEGWKLFKERLSKAQHSMDEADSFAATNPLWFIERLRVALGLSLPLDQQFAIYQRGIGLFPQYFPLHFQMLDALQPKWSGSWQMMREFIDHVVDKQAAATKTEIYTRMWWYMGQIVDADVDIFADLGASWTKMKNGFEALSKRYPKSVWTRSNFALFACRANDSSTYRRLRSELGDKIYKFAFPSNLSVDVCDERAAPKQL